MPSCVNRAVAVQSPRKLAALASAHDAWSNQGPWCDLVAQRRWHSSRAITRQPHAVHRHSCVNRAVAVQSPRKLAALASAHDAWSNQGPWCDLVAQRRWEQPLARRQLPLLAAPPPPQREQPTHWQAPAPPRGLQPRHAMTSARSMVLVRPRRRAAKTRIERVAL